MRASLSSGLVCLLLAVGTAAHAQGGDADAEARRLFRLGQAHYDNGEFQQAGQHFEQAYRLSRRPRLLYNAHVAYRDAQDLENAARTLRQFLIEQTDLPATERDPLEARLRNIERVLEQRRDGAGGTTTESTEGATETTSTGTDEGSTEEAGGATEGSGEASTGGATEASGGRSASGGATTAGGGPELLPFVVGGAGVALLAGGVVTGLMANSAAADLEEGCDGTRCPESLRDTRDRGQTLALVTDVLLALGVVGVATGAVLYFLGSDSTEEQPTASVGCGPDGCVAAVRGRF